jgi:parvulin-like peptidyl-prolyl isomerase
MTKKTINSLNSRNLLILLISAYCIVLIFSGGCASLQQKGQVLALVDGEPITEEDIGYSLTITHRREDLSSAGSLRLIDYVQKMVDDRLITDEARRAGMDEYPEVQQAVQAFILRESVVRLYNEEIVKHVTVTDQEILDFYKDNYKQFVIGLIEVGSEDKATEILDQLKGGGDFEEIAMKYSNHASRDKGGRIVLTKKGVPTYMLEAISHLKPGEISESISILDKFLIVKFIEQEEAPGGEEFKNLSGSIEKTIRKQKENERGEEYLQYLRGKPSIKIHEELLSEIDLDGGKEEIEKWSKDDSPLVEIDSSILTVGEFVSMARPSMRKTKEDILNSWIDRTLVDHEALSRHYEENPDLRDMVHRYENKLLKDTFIRRVVVPQIVITEEMVEEYYESHKDEFTKPALYRIQQITVKDKEEAELILDNLQNGADFSWLAQRKSVDHYASDGGDAGWFVKQVLPKPVQELIGSLNPGEITPVLEVGPLFLIVSLQEKKPEEVQEFDSVRDDVYKACFAAQVKSILDTYIAQLKADAQIVIYEETVESLEEKFLR